MRNHLGGEFYDKKVDGIDDTYYGYSIHISWSSIRISR